MGNSEGGLPEIPDQENTTGASLAIREDTGTVAVNGSPSQKRLSAPQRRALVRELATEEITRASLARKYNVSRPAITQFANRHAAEIDEIKKNLADEFAAQWIAQKELRVAQYQADVEMSAQGEYAGHYEQIRTRAQLLRNVAEELGQLPTRGNITVMPVEHIIVGIDPELLK